MLKCWCCFFGNRLKISLFLVVVVGVFTQWHILSSFTRNEGCKAKSESLLFFPVDLARERATQRAPGLLDSNALVPELITIYLLTPPSPIVMPWKRWMVDAHPGRSRSFLLQKWLLHVQSILRSTGIKGTILGYWDKKE